MQNANYYWQNLFFLLLISNISEECSYIEKDDSLELWREDEAVHNWGVWNLRHWWRIDHNENIINKPRKDVECVLLITEIVFLVMN